MDALLETDFADGKGLQVVGAQFDWPLCPKKGGGHIDLRVYESASVSAGYTTHLMDPHRDQAFFLGWHPGTQHHCGGSTFDERRAQGEQS